MLLFLLLALRWFRFLCLDAFSCGSSDCHNDWNLSHKQDRTVCDGLFFCVQAVPSCSSSWFRNHHILPGALFDGVFLHFQLWIHKDSLRISQFSPSIVPDEYWSINLNNKTYAILAKSQLYLYWIPLISPHDFACDSSALSCWRRVLHIHHKFRDFLGGYNCDSSVSSLWRIF